MMIAVTNIKLIPQPQEPSMNKNTLKLKLVNASRHLIKKPIITYFIEAIHFNSIAIGVGKLLISTVVLQGILSLKNSA